jgi:tRNA(Ile)-lysidine synthase
VSERAAPDHGSAVLRAVADGLAGVAPGEHLLVAVSGGPDSTALLVALLALAPAQGWRVTVAHVDHGVRGRDAAADRDAVARLATTHGVQLVERRLALAPDAGLEARARRARLRALTAMATACGASRILLAHTADDQAETVLLRLVRGAGRGGLAGMRRARGRFLRPLLGATRADVRRFLADRGADFVLDRSNADVQHARNRMRRLVLPVLSAEFNPRLTRHLAALADRLRDEDDLLEVLAAERARTLLDGAGLHAAVGDEPPALARRIVRRWLEAGRRAGVAAEHVERVLALARGGLGGVVALPGAWRVLREGDRLVRRAGRRPAARAFSMPIAPGANVCDAAGAWRMTLSTPEPAGAPLPRDPCEALFDAAQLGALWLRSRRPGDRIHLPGVGTRKLQDVLVDARVPREARDGLPLLGSGSEILWVPGVARGSGAAIGPQTRLVVRGLLERPGPRPGPDSGGRTLPMQNSHGT